MKTPFSTLIPWTITRKRDHEMTLVILMRRRLQTIMAISHYVVNRVLICANLGLGNASLR
jgi:hypothetical protein